MLNRGMLLAAVGGMSVILATSAAWGYAFNQIDIAGWSGPGSEYRAVTVVDFGGGSSFCFGYQWNNGQTVARPTDASGYGDFIASGYSATVPANTTEAELISLDHANPGLVSYHYDPIFGFAVDSFNYMGHSMVSDGWVTTYLAFWVSGNPAYTEYIYDASYNVIGTVDHPATAGDGQNWDYSQWGATSRALSDGYYDGWTLGSATTWYAPEPRIAPEPATMSLLVVGGAWLLRRRNVRVSRG